MENYTYLKKNRFERKYIADTEGYCLDTIISLHPAFFSTVYKPRYINNIYFDTADLSFFHDNVFGKSQRKKVRIRWYGQLFGEVKNPVLEIKIKNGAVGSKLSYPVKPFIFNKETTFKQLLEVIKQTVNLQDIDNSLLTLFPSLVNRYLRDYYLDFSKTFRFTVDTEINYFDIKARNNLFTNSFRDFENTILELKYDFDDNKNVSLITEHIPFRLTKNSKYVNGIEKFNFIND